MRSFFLPNWSPPDDPARPLPAEGRPWPSGNHDEVPPSGNLKLPHLRLHLFFPGRMELRFHWRAPSLCFLYSSDDDNSFGHSEEIWNIDILVKVAPYQQEWWDQPNWDLRRIPPENIWNSSSFFFWLCSVFSSDDNIFKAFTFIGCKKSKAKSRFAFTGQSLGRNLLLNRFGNLVIFRNFFLTGGGWGARVLNYIAFFCHFMCFYFLIGMVNFLFWVGGIC